MQFVRADSSCLSTTFSGILFVVLGVSCLFYPIIASVSIDVVTGSLLVVGAIASLFQLSRRSSVWRRVFYVLLALLYAIAGIVMVMNPFEGVRVMMLFFGLVFFSQGMFSIVYWKKLRGSGCGGFALFNAILSIILAFSVVFSTDCGIWIVGILVGINLLSIGVGIIFANPPDSRSDE